MIDAHIHLDQYPKDQIDRLIEEWQKRGIKGIVAVSTNLVSSYETLSWKDKYPDFIFPEFLKTKQPAHYFYLSLLLELHPLKSLLLSSLLKFVKKIL